ncbi:MAG: hypothetical protein ABI237_18135 [Ginsengibacter sp.]
MNQQVTTFIMIPKEEWENFKILQIQILEHVKQKPSQPKLTLPVSYITAKEFMEAVRIKRTKFDQLVAENKVQILKKGRKIYLQSSEIGNYFKIE